MNIDTVDTKGEFYRMNHQNHTKLQKLCQPVSIYIPAGSLVLWDNRLPHSTCNDLISDDTREVVYTGFLPNIPLNIKYATKQWDLYNKKLPPSYLSSCDSDYIVQQMSTNNKCLIGYTE